MMFFLKKKQLIDPMIFKLFDIVIFVSVYYLSSGLQGSDPDKDPFIAQKID